MIKLSNPVIKTFLIKKCKELEIEPEVILTDTVTSLYSPYRLKDMGRAVDLMVDCILNKTGKIIVNRDYDQDGILSGSINEIMLVKGCKVPRSRIYTLQNERHYGNGYNKQAMKEIAELHAMGDTLDIIITSDHGSADEARYKLTKELYPDIKILTTDHHLIPIDNPPVSVDAFVNPQQEGDKYSKNISGGVVTWLVMIAVIKKLEELGHPVDMNAINETYPFAAITTLCDQMNMLDPINRFIVNKGIEIMNKGWDPKWRVMRKEIGKGKDITDTDIAFLIGPMFNATGRMKMCLISHNFACSQSDREAGQRLKQLQEVNNDRKIWQLQVQDDCNKAIKTTEALKEHSLVIAIEEDITGVAGPVASRLIERHPVPVVILSRIEEEGVEVYKGSCRTIPKVHLFNTLNKVNNLSPTAMLKFGGHSGAAGVTIAIDKLEEFRGMFNHVCEEFMNSPIAVKANENDIIRVTPSEITRDLYEAVEMMAPFGNHWKQPYFSCSLELAGANTTRDGKHAMYKFKTPDGKYLEAFHLNGGKSFVRPSFKPVENLYDVTFALNSKTWAGKTTLSLFIHNMESELPF